jgi:hypothetical protein
VPAEITPGDSTQRTQAQYDLGSLIGTEASSLRWRSARCSTQSCVEVADLPGGGAAVRDGKLQEDSAVLVFTADEWRAFVAGVKQGEFG